MSTLLNYTITSTPQPLQASAGIGAPQIAQLTVVAVNNSHSPVTINWLELSMPIGTVANDLTNATTGFGTNLPAGWQLGSPSQSGGQYTFVFTVPNGGATVQAGQDIIFTISNIPLVTQPGSPVITITEGSSGKPTQNITLTIYPNGFGNISFTATPANIKSGGDVTLNWIGPTGATYSIQYQYNGVIITVPGNGDPPLASTGSYPGQGVPPLALNQTTVFTLTVTQVLNGVTFILAPQQTVSVLVDAPVISTFNTKPTTLTQQTINNPVTASWTGSNIAQIEIQNITYTGTDPNSGSMQITLNNSTWMQASATGFPGASPAGVKLKPPYFIPYYNTISWAGNVSGYTQTVPLPNSSAEAIQLNVQITGVVGLVLTISIYISSINGNKYTVLGNSPQFTQVAYPALANQPKTQSFNNTEIFTGAFAKGQGYTGSSVNEGASWFVVFPNGLQMVISALNTTIDSNGNLTCNFQYFDFPEMPVYASAV